MTPEQLARLFRSLLPHVPMTALLVAAEKAHAVAPGVRLKVQPPAEKAACDLLVAVALGGGPKRERPVFGG